VSVRADWRLADLLDEADPFENVIYSSGLQVDLDGSEEDLVAALQKALRIEGRLDAIGLSCPLKDGGQDCLTCRQSSTDRQVPLTKLCELGKDQQTLVRRMDDTEKRRRAPLMELVGAIDGFSEIGHLDGAYDELLTAVGL
jgi:hypothetical protein